MALTVGLGVATVRILYLALGEEGYGIFTAVVASGAVLSLLNNSLVSAARRSLAFEIGTGDASALRDTFSSVLFIFSLFAVVTVTLGMLSANSLVSALSMPDTRKAAAIGAFQLSIASIGVNLLQTPHNAVIEAHQDMVAVSAIEVIHRILALAAAIGISYLPYDPVFAYAALLFAVTTLVALLRVGLSLARYSESSILFDRPQWVRVKPIFTFAGWSIIAALTQFLQGKATVVLVNMYFGPAVNAAYSLGHQAVSYVTQVCVSLSRAAAPAAITMEGRGESTNLKRMSALISRYSSYILIAFGTPLAVDAEFVLEKWVGGGYPPAAGTFLRLLILFNFANMLSWGDAIAAEAKAKIALLNSAFLLAFALTFVGVWAIWEAGNENAILMAQAVAATTFAMSVVFRPLIVGRCINRRWSEFARLVLGKILAIALPCVLVAYLIASQSTPGFGRYAAIQGAVILTLLVLIPLFGIEAWERSAWARVSHRAFAKLRQ